MGTQKWVHKKSAFQNQLTKTKMNITYQPKAKWLWFYLVMHTMPSYLRKRESLIFGAVVTASPCRRYTKPLDRAETIIQHSKNCLWKLSSSWWHTQRFYMMHSRRGCSAQDYESQWELWMLVITFPAGLAGCLEAKHGSTSGITQKWLCARAPFPIPLPSYIYEYSKATNMDFNIASLHKLKNTKVDKNNYLHNSCTKHVWGNIVIPCPYPNTEQTTLHGHSSISSAPSLLSSRRYL